MSRIDHYPSRTHDNAKLTERLCPVVYSAPQKPSPISPELIQQYDEQGFLVLEGLFNEQEVEALQQEALRLRTDPVIAASDETITERNSSEIRSVFRVHQISPTFEHVMRDPRIAKIAEYILDDALYIHQSRLNYKPGFRGKEFYWHSDFETWHVEDGMPRMRALSISITLTDNYTHNGALMLMPGSHRQYAVCEGETPANHYQASLKKQEYGVPADESLRQLAQQHGIVTATGKAGSVIIFDCNVMHGSNSNISPDPRSNLFFVYNAVSNRVEEPFCAQPPRPEHICTRELIEPLSIN